ncbi:ParB/RepB/Spo0J family partition protein [Halalkalibacter oceani]|uniref:ParB/RepB/Spo0J family partition protein n=1 Tax=Halalkalibacter oceani TaxID=1653776 RepID=UPI00339971A3
MNKTQTLKLDEIVPNPNQPRKQFDETSLSELASSIVSDGLKSPILVRPIGEEAYEIVQGERRFRACQIAGLETIVAFVEEMGDDDAFHLAVIENIQREQLTAIEEASAFQRYVEMGFKHDEIAKKVSKSRTYVTSRLRLLQLIPIIQDWISQKVLTEGHAKQLLKMKSIVERFLRKYEDGRDSFESFQWRFHHDFWYDIAIGKRITVNEVQKWVDLWRYHYIESVVNNFYINRPDEVSAFVSGFELTAAHVCRIYNLEPHLLTIEDIEFANDFERSYFQNSFSDEFRPWMVDRKWDDVKIIFEKQTYSKMSPPNFSISDLNKKEEPQSLDEIVKSIKGLKEKADTAIGILSDITGKSTEELFDEIVSQDTFETNYR